MKKIEFENLYKEISILKQAVNEIAEYLKFRDDREISFYLNCSNVGLDDREISQLFLFYCRETDEKSLSELENLIEDPVKLIERSRIFINKFENTHEDVIKNIIKAFIYNYPIRNLLEEDK